ncbi:retropepsin-like aspartic protease [Salinimonas chungwhensis]|uniref:retropepsin-like aspartic protease n=1 Tax=Salinimonas chungwhensis TaxID=265425 RepID=UPI00039CADF7|nr:retropepsin-like aspartic protease [Salinimonas chungwhensis]
MVSLLPLTFFANSEEHQFALQKHGGGTLYLDIMVGQAITASFLVDTGSGLVTLNQRTFDQLRQQGRILKRGFIAARMANGSIERVQQYRLESISIDNRCELGPVDVAVIPAGSNIIGINALMKAAPITITSDALGLSGCNNQKT